MTKRMDGEPMRYGAGFCDPNAAKDQRLAKIAEDICPECGGELDTGWECNKCGFDAKPEYQASSLWKGDR
jgi:hypothetical protein